MKGPALLIAGVLALCGGSAPAARQTAPPDIASAIRSQIDSRSDRAALNELYGAAGQSPLWLDAGYRPNQNGRDALALLRRAADEGLDPVDYRVDLPAVPADAARFDVALSVSTLRYLHDLHLGRVDPRTIGFKLDLPADRHDFAALLRAALDGHRIADAAAALRPPLAQYRALCAMLARYRFLAAEEAVQPPPAFARTVRPGDTYDSLEILYRELLALGDLQPDAEAPGSLARYEGTLVEGVKRFQIRHGLEPDGVLGRNTLAALRVPIEWRVRQIELALERLRWLPDLDDARLIALNIPMFRFAAWDVIPANERPALSMDAIVGRALRTQTPVFSDELTEVIFRPYWNVPSSILRNEILPAVARDPSYLRKHDMEVVRGSGDDAEPVDVTPDALDQLRRGSLRLRQRPGPQNSLGLIKFVFPNDHNVYMHGTPAQELFARSRRDFSHGCVRVADPVALAEWALRDEGGWDRERILSTMEGSESLRVKLTRPIRVLLFYTTAAALPEDGTVRFAEDIYHHDARLDRALAARRRPAGAPDTP